MAYTFRNDFIDGWIAHGKALARADDILRILKSRRLRTTPAQRSLINACKDPAKLDLWFDRALVVKAAAELFAEDENEDG